jgi:hypothetical protein
MDINKIKAKIATTSYRYDKAVNQLADYNGKDTAEKHRLSLIVSSAETAKIEAEKALLAISFDAESGMM